MIRSHAFESNDESKLNIFYSTYSSNLQELHLQVFLDESLSRFFYSEVSWIVNVLVFSWIGTTSPPTHPPTPPPHPPKNWTGAPGWLGWLSYRLDFSSGHISGSWDRAPCRTLCLVWHLLGIFSLPLPLPTPSTPHRTRTHSFSLSLSKRKTKWTTVEILRSSFLWFK